MSKSAEAPMGISLTDRLRGALSNMVHDKKKELDAIEQRAQSI